MIDAFFDGMTSGRIAIVGALFASVVWMFVVVWLMDRPLSRMSDDGRRRRGERWR